MNELTELDVLRNNYLTFDLQWNTREIPLLTPGYSALVCQRGASSIAWYFKYVLPELGPHLDITQLP